MGTPPATPVLSLWHIIPATTTSIFTSLSSNTNILQNHTNYHINYKGTYPSLTHVVHSHFQPLQQLRLILWSQTEQSHNSCEERHLIYCHILWRSLRFDALWPGKKKWIIKSETILCNKIWTFFEAKFPMKIRDSIISGSEEDVFRPSLLYITCNLSSLDGSLLIFVVYHACYEYLRMRNKLSSEFIINIIIIIWFVSISQTDYRFLTIKIIERSIRPF